MFWKYFFFLFFFFDGGGGAKNGRNENKVLMYCNNIKQ